MRQKEFLYLIWFATIFAGCSFSSQSPDILPFIDVRKNYPEKEIVLTDIADITYLHLSTQNDEFLYRGEITYETENSIVVADWSSNSILIFSKDGNPKSRFNRYGQGPEDYGASFLFNVTYDETTDEVFIPVDFRNYIQVYSSTGEYKRKITLPQVGDFGHNMNSIMVPFDNQSFLLYSDYKLRDQMRKKEAGEDPAFLPQLHDSSFMLISKTDGKTLEYIEVPSPATDIMGQSGTFAYARITKCTDGFLLCNPENDTVYLYKKDKTLMPVLRKIPLMSEGEPLVLNNCLDVGKYQFMSVSYKRSFAQRLLPPQKYYMREKKTAEVFHPKIILHDYKGKEFFIYIFRGFARYFENEFRFTLNLSELKQAERENRLSGKLKELVSTLNEDEDNDVFMLVKFK